MTDAAEGLPALTRRPPDGYNRIWKKFVQFVEEKVEPGEREAGKYLTRKSVDLYFEEVVAYRDEIQPKTAAKIASALQWYADHLEYTDEEDSFRVRSYKANSRVEKALSKQANNFANKYAQKNHDAHANLPTNVLSIGDHRKVMFHIFTSMRNWEDMALAWTCTNDTFLRLDSMMKMRLPDVRCDKTHGPVDEGVNCFIMSYILQPYQHKDTKVGGNAGNKTNKRRDEVTQNDCISLAEIK